MLVSYIRDKNNRPVGCVVALDKDLIGVSLHNPKDHYKKEIGRSIAAGRALSGRDLTSAIPDISGKKKDLVARAYRQMRLRAMAYFQE